MRIKVDQVRQRQETSENNRIKTTNEAKGCWRMVKKTTPGKQKKKKNIQKQKKPKMMTKGKIDTIRHNLIEYEQRKWIWHLKGDEGKM